jgi:hypothetical protein
MQCKTICEGSELVFFGPTLKPHFPDFPGKFSGFLLKPQIYGLLINFDPFYRIFQFFSEFFRISRQISVLF